MEPPRGFWSTLWRLFYFLPFFIGLLLLGIIKGALLCPIVCLIMTIGNSAIILGLWPAHAFWTFYCIARAKQLGPVLKLVLSVAVSVLLVLWPLIGILGSILTGAGYGFLMPIMATFDAIGEGKEDKFLHCIRDGIWSTIKGSCTVVRDLKDVSFHSYFSIMDDLRLQNARNGRPYEIRLTCIPGAFLAGVAGILIDLPMITLIALFKSPYMLFKGWNRLFHDLIGREGPFLETACVPFAGLAILLWPAAVVGAALASILSSLALGGYAAVVAYQESSIKMGMAYTFSSLSMFDEYSNDVLDLPEGSCFPRYRYRKNPSSGTSSGSTSFNQENCESKNPSRTTSFKGAMAEIKPLKVSQVALSLSHAGYESTCLPPWRTRGPALKSTKRAFIGAAAHTLQPVSKPATTRRVVEAGRARTPDLLDKKLFIELPASTTRRAVAGSSGCVWAATLMKARLVDSRTGPLVLQGGRQLLEQLFAECKLYGDNLVAEQVITVKDVKEFKSGKTGSSIISVGLPAYCILQALVRSAKENVDGLLLSDNTEIMTQNRPKDTFFDFFFDPLMIIKEQIRIENFTEEEEGYLCKLVLLLGHPDRLSLMTAASSPQNERRRAEINAIARRLQGITKSISRYPTVRRRYDELLKSFSEELERKMGGSEHRYQSGRSFLKTFSLNSLEIKAGGRGIDEEAQLTSDPTVRLN